MIERLFDRTRILEKSLDAAWLRNEAISHNIANVDTPGYKRKDVSFEEHLNQAMNDANPTGGDSVNSFTPVSKINLDGINPEIVTENSSLSMRIDGNNVDIDSEMAALAKNSIRYNVLIQSMNSEFSRLRSAITEGRK